jgi:hypothetical protein
MSTSKYDSHFLDKHSYHARPCPAVPNPTFSVLGHCIINAPPAAVYDALLDLPNYRNWNTFVTTATLQHPGPDTDESSPTHMHTGARFEFKVKMKETSDSMTSSKEICTIAEPLRTPTADDPTPTTTARWGFDSSVFPGLKYLLKAEHVNELRDLGDGRTEYVHWESFGGVLANLIWWLNGEDLGRAFRNWSDELKVYVEKQQARK